MGSYSDYSSPKVSSVREVVETRTSSPVTPKSGSYESPKVPEVPVSKPIGSSTNRKVGTSIQRDLNSFRELITNYLEVNEQIEKTKATLKNLEQQKSTLERNIVDNPEYEKFSEMFNSLDNSKGPKR